MNLNKTLIALCVVLTMGAVTTVVSYLSNQKEEIQDTSWYSSEEKFYLSMYIDALDPSDFEPVYMAQNGENDFKNLGGDVQYKYINAPQHQIYWDAALEYQVGIQDEDFTEGFFIIDKGDSHE